MKIDPRRRLLLTLVVTGVLATGCFSTTSASSSSTTPSIIVSLGPASMVPKPSGVLNSRFQPNDTLDVVPQSGGPLASPSVSAADYLNAAKSSTGPWNVYWPEGQTSLASGPSPYPGSNEAVPSEQPVIPTSFDWDNGGAWVNSVFRVGAGSLVAFFHAEHHYFCDPNLSPPAWCPYATHNGKGMFWASAGVAYSSDNGQTWSPAEQFLTAAQPQPSTPTLGGVNFYRVVWDFTHDRWMAFFDCQGGFSCAAISTDPLGRPGTWYDYDKGQFNQPGLGGTATPLPGLERSFGVTYAVQYDSALGVWLAWGREFGTDGVFVAASHGLIHWSTPQLVVGGVRAFYPVMVGKHGTDVLGSTGNLYYVTGLDIKEPVLWERPATIRVGSVG